MTKKNRLFFSKFTPSLMTKESLRELFVQREWLLSNVLAGLEESTSSGAKHHYLLLGPRGIGKTHFVSLLSYALEELPVHQDSFLIAWLREEEWGVASYLDLLIRLLRSLAERYEESEAANSIEFLLECPLDRVEQVAQQLLLDLLKKRTLIIVAENLNTLFEGLGAIGQKRFRALIQESGQIALVATAPMLFSDVQLQTSPFYGFFAVHYFEELTAQEARHLVLRMADLQKDEQLIAFVNTPEGQARIRVIYHLAGGNHRIYVILSQFLARIGLDELVDLILEMIDDLTPYYQAQISTLSTQQQKIVDLMCDQSYALPVKEIAARCFISHQTTSSQLKDLKDRRFVTSFAVGREQWYELREPLMRICLESKKQRGKPIKLLVQLLRTWYSARELKEIAGHFDPAGRLSSSYLNAALLEKAGMNQSSSRVHKTKDGELVVLEEAINRAVESQEQYSLLRLYETMVEKRGLALDWLVFGYCLTKDGQLLRALDAIERAIALDIDMMLVRDWRIYLLMKLGRLEEALSYIEEWLQEEPLSSEAWRFKGDLLAGMGDFDEALACFQKLTKREPKFVPGWLGFGIAYFQIGCFDEAVDALNNALRVDKNNILALSVKGAILEWQGEYAEALQCFSKAIKLNPGDETLVIDRCKALINFGDFPRALKDAERAVELAPENLSARFGLALALFCNQMWSQATSELEALMEHSKESYSSIGDLGALLRFLLEKLHDKDEWQARASELLGICQRHETLIELAAGVMNTVPSLLSDDLSLRHAGDWVALWEGLVGNVDAFAMPFRILKVALKYKETRNPHEGRILLTEERAIFDSLLREFPALVSRGF